MKIGFTDDNRGATKITYPLLKLDKDEVARVCLLDAEPEAVYVHTLYMPVVKDGQIVMETRKKADGSEYEVDARDYVGAHACSGDYETVWKNEIDPDACASCKNVQDFPEFFAPPVRKFAQHVIQYKTKPGSFEIQTPFSAELVAWTFTERRFNELIQMAKEHGSLREIDLLLGPCASKMYQNYDIKAGAKCEWLADDKRKDFVKELYASNQCEDLEALIARRPSPTQVAIDVEKVKQRHAQLNSSTSSSATSAPATTLSESDLSSMLGVPDTAETAESTPEAAPEAAPEPEESPEPKVKATSGSVSLEDLLGGL